MVQLTSEECRVLGVLIEKELTTPEQYPLSLNAAVNGANQKNNRDPVMTMHDDDAFTAIEGLREKGLLVRVEAVGSRVPKFKHTAGEKLQLNRYQLVILAELLLRGPQTVGELRGRASRMHHLDSLEVVKEMLDSLVGRPQPLVAQLPPIPGTRAERYMQLLCPDAHPAETPPAAETAEHRPNTPALNDRVARLEQEVAVLRETVRKLAVALGEPDPLERPENT